MIENFKNCDVDILGEKYTIKSMTSEENEKLELLDASGIAELHSKEIIIKKFMEKELAKTDFENLENYVKKTLRHEMLHCFFYESGHENYSGDEALVELLAIIFPKIIKAMNNVDCL